MSQHSILEELMASMRAATCLSGLALAGCTVGPDFHSPQTDLAPFHNTALVTQGNAAASATSLSAYWTNFNDPVLTDIVRRTLAQNLSLTAALARVQEARAAAGEAGAQLLPTADANAQATALHQSLYSPLGAIAKNLPGYNRDQRVYDVGAKASWEIDLFGGLRRGAEAARAEAQAAEAENIGTQVTVVAEASDAYFQIRGDQERLQVAQQQIDTDQRLVTLVEKRLAAGAAADRELDEATALLTQAQSAVPPLQTDLEAQCNRLDILMGLQPGSYARTLRPRPQPDAVPPVPADITPQAMLQRRPDVLAAQAQLRAANARIGVAVSSYYPKISLAGLLGFESLDANRFFTGTAFQPQVVAGLRWRLFDFGKIDDEVKQAKGSYAESLANFRMSILAATGDVENAMMALAQDEQEESDLQHEVTALQKSRDSSQRSYAGGSIPLTDVLDADRELLQAQDGLAQIRATTERDSVSLFRSLGGGW
jgi:NodT family efflux transporter outer membrane factor (OMF) lipoprotein